MNIQINRNTTAKQLMTLKQMAGFQLHATRNGGAELVANNAKRA